MTITMAIVLAVFMYIIIMSMMLQGKRIDIANERIGYLHKRIDALITRVKELEGE